MIILCLQSLEEENDRLLLIIENKNLIINDNSKTNYNMPDFATKQISQLTERVQELMLELQTIKSFKSNDNESILLNNLQNIKLLTVILFNPINIKILLIYSIKKNN